jgi:hypothetical protein
MNTLKRSFLFLALLALVFGPVANEALASTASNTVPNTVTLNLSESATLTVSVGTVSLSSGAPSAPVTLTYGYQIASGHTTGKIYAWFTNAAFSGGDGGGALTSGAVSTQFGGGATVACSQGAFAGASGAAGIAGQNCGSYSIPEVVGSTFNVSGSTVILNVILGSTGNNGASASAYTNTLNVMLEIA